MKGTKDAFNIAAQLLDRNAKERGNKTALLCGDEKVTYGEVLENVNKFANILKELNVKPAERVMIHLPDSPVFVYALKPIPDTKYPLPPN